MQIFKFQQEALLKIATENNRLVIGLKSLQWKYYTGQKNADSEPIWYLDEIWSTVSILLKVDLANFGRDPSSIESLRGRIQAAVTPQ